MQANEAIKDIPKEDVTSRMIRWQDAYQKAKAADESPIIPIGRRGQRNLARYNKSRNKRFDGRFRDPGDRR